MAKLIRDSDTGIHPILEARIKSLSGAKPAAFYRQIAYAWSVIACCVLIAVMANSIIVTLLAALVISTRQNLLGLLVHEQVHRLGSRGKHGDLITNLLCAYPLIVLSIEGYAKAHLAHHKYFFTDKDPDFLRKSGEEWDTPITTKKAMSLVAKDIIGLGVLKLMRGKRYETLEFARRKPTPEYYRFVFWIAMLAVTIATGTFWHLLALWILPILTFAQVWVRLGALSEHKYNVNSTDLDDSTFFIENTWWEKLLLPNINFTLHHLHHMYPGISFSLLPHALSMYRQCGLVNEDVVIKGYSGFFKKIIKNPPKRV